MTDKLPINYGDTGKVAADKINNSFAEMVETVISYRPHIENGEWWIGDTNTGVKAKGDSISMKVEDGYIRYKSESENWTQIIAIEDLKGPQGEPGQDGEDGQDGNGISSVVATKSGKITTVTISFTNGSEPYSFQILDGQDGQGSGDVIGPESSTDGHLALFDGVTGKLIKDGGPIPTPTTVVDNLTTQSATSALSANQGYVLKGYIDNLMAQGKFLSLWNSTTGQPISFPKVTPYTYKTGDYFMVEEAYPNLPAGYSLLDYVTFSGTEILDTGLILNQDSKIESKFIGDIDNCWIYGTGSSNPRITAYLASTGNQRFGNVSVGNTGIDKNTLYTLIQDKTGFDLNGEKKTYSGVGTFTCTASLTIGNSNGSTGTPYFDGNFYYMKIWNDGELVMHLVACKDSNNVVGMYDIIGNTFYTPTVGTLIAGNEIHNYKPNGSSYSGTASSTVETGEVAVGDYYVYDGSVWLLATNHGKTVSFANLAGDAMDNVNLAGYLNTKTFYLSSGSDLTTAQAAYEWQNGGKTALIIYNNKPYTYLSGNAASMNFKCLYPYEKSSNQTGKTELVQDALVFSLSSGTVTSISTNSRYNTISAYLNTDQNYTTPYTPQYDGSPATKKYVDDIVGDIETLLANI